tara:strand:- start:926 stop:1663 length:738 start_codon:yes stop_codon:yes gene_type:complete
MSKNSVNDYSSTADSNTDVGGISIAEGMLPSNVNNSLREIMSHTADWVAGTTPLSTINIDGGAIDGVNLGANSAGTVAGTTGSFSSVVSFASGTSSAPSLTNTGDTNTGLYFSGADEVSLTTGGTQRLSVDANGHLNINNSSSADVSIVSPASTVTLDFNTAQNFQITLDQNITLASSNLNVGMTGSIFLVQNSSGSNTVSFGSNFKFSGATAPTLTTTANAVDVIFFQVKSSTEIVAVALLNIS